MKCDGLKVRPYTILPSGQCYDKDEADAAIAELKAENERLKAKLETVQASAYADSVDAGMRERRLRRALWLARAERAKAMYTYWHVKCIEGYLLYEHKWIVVERKCLKKAGQYR